jgi:tetratricopeptide (TPR) repeat protein
MVSYENWLGDGPELAVLRMLGLFDRPAEAGAVAALRAGPEISGLTDPLAGLSEPRWRQALARLRRARLLAETDPAVPGALDCHPLVREHFGERLEAEQADAWRGAHGRLYEYYAAQAPDVPDTLEQMMPLYVAVAHGCQAGRHQEALDEVYWRRIQRGNEAYSVHKLGAFGADLAVLSGFFDPPWRRPLSGLSEADQAYVLAEAGFALRALGRLAEAAEPMRAALEAAIAREDWKNAAINAENLSELFLTTGDIGRSLDFAEKGVEYADESNEPVEQRDNRTTLADSLHQAGRPAEAESLFGEAEAMQKELQPEYPVLYSLRGYQYCDLLLGQGKYHEVQRRAEKFFEWREPSDSLLTIALDHLSLGRAYLLEVLHEDESPKGFRRTKLRTALGSGYAQAATHLDRAVDGLGAAGQQQELPRGLLARAALRRATGDFEQARADLDEAAGIAARGGMRLHQADCHLEYARLHLAQNDPAQARQYLAAARTLVDETGYHRRDAEVAALAAELGEA